MTTLADIRSRARTDLHDTDSGAYRWSDADLDRHIAHALDDVSRAIPLEQSATIPTTAGSRDVSLESLAGLIEVEAVEYPVGEFPPSYTGFTAWAGTLSLHTPTAPDGSDAKLYFTARHVLDADGATLPGHLEDLVAAGAGAYAALEWSAFTIDRLNTGGNEAAKQYESWARARLTAFEQLLKHHARRNTVRPRRLYIPA